MKVDWKLNPQAAVFKKFIGHFQRKMGLRAFLCSIYVFLLWGHSLLRTISFNFCVCVCCYCCRYRVVLPANASSTRHQSSVINGWVPWAAVANTGTPDMCTSSFQEDTGKCGDGTCYLPWSPGRISISSSELEADTQAAAFTLCK